MQSVLCNEIFPTVTKPNRYTGVELNAIRKDHAETDIRIVLAFPDAYELGMSYLGFGILYHILNRCPDVLAERVYAPWVDMEERLRGRSLPLFSLESKRPLRDFDVVAFTLPYELCCTNILNMLELSSIPLQSDQRGEDDPLVLAGGIGAYNPEPLAEFVDAFVIGDAEEAVLEIVGVLRALRGSPRREILRAWSELEGVYVPSLHSPRNPQASGTGDLLATSSSCKIAARTVAALVSDQYPDKPLVPYTEIEHDRLTLEIMRGCPRRCRFCNATVLYRPVRTRPMEEIVRQAESGIQETGYNEVSLLSLSAADYPGIAELILTLQRRLASRRVSIALPSLRPDTFTLDLAQSFQSARRGGLTFAPEAGTDRLRRVLHKNIKSEDLLNAVEIAFRHGWNTIKLYFMIGLPTEQDEDIEAIVQLVRDAARIGASCGDNKFINVSISPFSPKAHTPFQWAAQDDVASLKEKGRYLQHRLQHRRISLRWRDPQVSLIEGALARGDRRLSRVILAAREAGGRFDGWSDFFSFEIWQKAFDRAASDPFSYVAARRDEEPLPWDFIEIGTSKESLLAEWHRSQREDETTCAQEPSPARVIQDPAGTVPGPTPETAQPEEASSALYGRGRKVRGKTPLQIARGKIRIKYTKGPEMRFLSHLDLVRAFERALRRADLSISYSQGFHPHPKISFGPPLSLGMTSRAEFVDIQLEQPFNSEMIKICNRTLPRSMTIIEAKPVFGKTASLSSVITRATYRIRPARAFSTETMREAVARVLDSPSLVVQRTSLDSVKQIDIRPFILGLEVETGDGDPSLLLTLRTTETGHVKPGEIIGLMFGLSHDVVLQSAVERTEQMAEQDGRVMSPMDCV